jgi:hypothetical protein
MATPVARFPFAVGSVFPACARRRAAAFLIALLAGLEHGGAEAAPATAADAPEELSGSTSATATAAPAHDTRKIFTLEAGLETSSFLHTLNGRSESSSTLTLGAVGRYDGRRIDAVLDAQTKVFMSDVSSLTLEAKEAYVATDSLLPAGHQAAFGRRIYDWSVADQTWGLGLWSPRFKWDPLHPETIGRTGLWYSYTAKRWRAFVHASVLSVPEKGMPIFERDGRLVSASPYWVAPPEYVLQDGNLLPIRYQIQYPNVTRILFQPGLAASVRVGDPADGPWGAATVGVLPVKEPRIAVEPRIKFEDQVVMRTTIHPTFPYQKMATLEGGYGSAAASAWFSLTRDIPFADEIPEGSFAAPIGPAWIASLGGTARVHPRVSVSAAFLRAEEKVGTFESAEFVPTRISRFGYVAALKGGFTWNTNERLTNGLVVTYDVKERCPLVSWDTSYLLPGIGVGGKVFGGLRVGMGADLILGPSQEGYIGQYFGRDRVRWTLAYGF